MVLVDPIYQRWQTRLRSIIIVGELFGALALRLRGGDSWSCWAMVGLALLSALLNGLASRLKEVLKPAWVLTAFLVFDVAQLTAVFALSGGAANPFSAAYLLPVAFAALALPLTYRLLIALQASASFAWLLWSDLGGHAQHMGPGFINHLIGMWLAMSLTALFVAVFVGFLASALREREIELSELRTRTYRAERLASLANLAAGTAHVLNTPLGTMAIAAAELSDMLAGRPEQAYADTIRSELKRCKLAVSAMMQGAMAQGAVGDAELDPVERVSVKSLVSTTLEEWQRAHPAQLVERRLFSDDEVHAAPQALKLALLTVLDNAGDVLKTEPKKSIAVTVQSKNDQGARAVVEIGVRDDGPGIDPLHQGLVGEPFFTTKPHGEGSGLGLYVARQRLARFGASLLFEHGVPRGTCVRIILPLEQA